MQIFTNIHKLPTVPVLQRASIQLYIEHAVAAAAFSILTASQFSESYPQRSKMSNAGFPPYASRGQALRGNDLLRLFKGGRYNKG